MFEENPNLFGIRPSLALTLSARPLRDAIINSEDVLNLKIALDLHKDVLDFLQDPYLFS